MREAMNLCESTTHRRRGYMSDARLPRLRREVSAAPRARRRATREIQDSETSGIRTRILPVDTDALAVHL